MKSRTDGQSEATTWKVSDARTIEGCVTVRPERSQARDHRIHKTSFFDLTSRPEVGVSLLLAVITKRRFADAGREHRCGMAELDAEVVVAYQRTG